MDTIPCTAALPMPGSANTCSTITVPPISRPRLIPANVTNEMDDGRNTSLRRIREVGMPLARAASTYCWVIVSLASDRTSRRYTAISPAASVRTGSAAWRRFSTGSSVNGTQPATGSQPSAIANT